MNTAAKDIKRHTVALNEFHYLEPGLDQQKQTLTHWKTIEDYYRNHLNALQKEIEKATEQNQKLTDAREELVQEVLKLHKKSTELISKNEELTRTIAEKENHISAFMYHPLPETKEPIQGVTLVDKPYSPPTPPPNTSSIDTPSETSKPSQEPEEQPKAPVVNKEPGLFRKISLRLSTRKRRQQDDPPLQISEPINIPSPPKSMDAIVPTTSVSEPLIHPAAVVATSPIEHLKLVDSNKRKKNLVFGNDLVQQARSENTLIPSIVTNCIREVELRGFSVEGIYRKSGTLSQIKELQDAIEKHKNPKFSKYSDINVITSVLKLYFRELPTPLISNKFILPLDVDSQERLNKTHALFQTMPNECYQTIKLLMQHLRRVHQNNSANRMPSKNLAVIFGPTLMRFTAGNEEQQMRDMIDTVDYIILQSHLLFY
ncbi:hypothetical protein CU098_003904 [Rhizopus stolonifer]|uniref:Rho-GAP domain-containing protein n=1 Tax=Rhizopus stolonifer TaxID=4846 RepID=A0A367KPR2_RHIST|nr:hypothetical protein CU098_003904 [Rhizopus stolonifer]